MLNFVALAFMNYLIFGSYLVPPRPDPAGASGQGDPGLGR